jgi:hypothetical protein
VLSVWVYVASLVKRRWRSIIILHFIWGEGEAKIYLWSEFVLGSNFKIGVPQH